VKKLVKSVLIILSLVAFISLAALWGLVTGDIRLPSDLTRSAQSAETLYAKVTADIEAVNVELTKMALEPASTFIPTPSVTSQDWLDHFLHNPTCRIPCWENITPNMTEIHTAQKIVAGISGVQVIYLEPKEIAWYFDDDSSKSAQIIANQDGVVLQTYLRLGYDQTLLLSDVINSFGNPDAIVEGMDCNHVLSYRYQGMLLSAYTSCSYNPMVDIMPTTEIDRIILFSPDNQEHTLSVFRFNMDEIMWDGYKTYDFRNK
jgi:hypothetical protein